MRHGPIAGVDSPEMSIRTMNDVHSSECAVASPPRVDYELTDMGEALLPIIDARRRFGHTWLVDEPARHGSASHGR